MSEKQLPVETNVNVKDIQPIIRDVLNTDEFPDDKKVEISVEFMVVPKTMDIKISKK